MTTLRVARAITAHDLAMELRRPVAIAGVALFGAASLVTMHLALAGSSAPDRTVAAGALWVILVYAALLGVGRGIAVEREESTWDGLLLAAGDRSAIFLGKAASSFLLTLALHAVLVPLYLAIFAQPENGAGYALLAVAVVLADAGFALVGVLVGVLGLRARNRELLAATAFVPLVLPLVIAAAALSLSAFGLQETASSGRLLVFLAAYDATFLAVGVAAVPEIAVE